jgi:hypothetical protein
VTGWQVVLFGSILVLGACRSVGLPPDDRAFASDARVAPLRIGGGTWSAPSTGRGGEPVPFVGACGERIELGLDTRADLEIRRKDWVVGLVYLVVPVLMTDAVQVRFPRAACPEAARASGPPIPSTSGARVPPRESETDACYTEPAEAPGIGARRDCRGFHFARIPLHASLRAPIVLVPFTRSPRRPTCPAGRASI